MQLLVDGSSLLIMTGAEYCGDTRVAAVGPAKPYGNSSVRIEIHANTAADPPRANTVCLAWLTLSVDDAERLCGLLTVALNADDLGVGEIRYAR